MLARILGPQKLLLGLTGAAALLTVGLVGAAGSSSAAPAAAGGAALAADATSYDPVPSAIRVPPGNRLVARLDAQGVQVYQCTAGAWGFLEPVAALSDRSPADATIHFRGPSWESIRDGSLVEATTIASSPVVGSIPQLLPTPPAASYRRPHAPTGRPGGFRTPPSTASTSRPDCTLTWRAGKPQDGKPAMPAVAAPMNVRLHPTN